MRVKDSRKSHFFWAHDDIFDIWGEILKANGIAIYLCLVRHADSNGTCYPSFSTIAKKSGVSRSTVIRTINKLVELGLIKREQRITEQIQSKGEEKTSNLYTILDLPPPPSARETLPLVSERHYPSVRETLPQCQKDTTPSVRETPKGRHRLKEDTIEKHTDKDVGTEKNSDFKTVRQSSVDLNLSHLNWPKNLNKAQPVMTALAKLFDDYARQQVLDVVAKALEKGTIEKPIAFLQGVVKNYLNGDFTPIEKPLAQTSSQTSVQTGNYPDAQTQSRLDRIESKCNEEKTMAHLEQTFQQNRRDQVEKIMANWDDNTREVELADFRKNTGSTVRAQYTKLGLDSRLVKSALTEYVANKHLPIDENNFVTWAKKQGYEVEGSDTAGFRLNAAKRIGNVLEKCVPKIDKNAQTRAKLEAMIGGFKQETEVVAT